MSDFESDTDSDIGSAAFTRKRNKYVDPCQNPSSPYYLHPGENPGMVLFSPPLNGSNYYSWSKGMRRALVSKNKLKFINGALPIPDETDSDFEAWDRCNSTVISWISNANSSNSSNCG